MNSILKQFFDRVLSMEESLDRFQVLGTIFVSSCISNEFFFYLIGRHSNTVATNSSRSEDQCIAMTIWAGVQFFTQLQILVSDKKFSRLKHEETITECSSHQPGPLGIVKLARHQDRCIHPTTDIWLLPYYEVHISILYNPYLDCILSFVRVCTSCSILPFLCLGTALHATRSFPIRLKFQISSCRLRN